MTFDEYEKASEGLNPTRAEAIDSLVKTIRNGGFLIAHPDTLMEILEHADTCFDLFGATWMTRCIPNLYVPLGRILALHSAQSLEMCGCGIDGEEPTQWKEESS